nr:immunoglobulin light chain junction region [Macaca mulatta]MOW36628.1 immunoglobulin light chain junction region [Macaca mulatta]MOW36699.1 immunoglobulin light chain junction region [Macaca mulatta]MOW37362.1 immunoglobulin light chain junction region [Macaca mulatta]MOW37478.1 immunoglobulin light chain junction region [Macaca mulatta]
EYYCLSYDSNLSVDLF